MTRKTLPGATKEVSSVAPPPASILRCFGELCFHTDGDLAALAFGPDGTLWSVEEPGLLRQWDPLTGQPIGCAFLSDLETLWHFSADARLLASANDEVSLWDVSLGRLLAKLPQPSWVTAVAFDAGGRFLATGHDDGTTRLWDVVCHRLAREFQGHHSAISALTFSPDGARLACAAEDRIVSLWEIATGRQIGICSGHTDRIHGLAWHPRGHRLVSAGWDTTARVWDAVSLEPIILLNSHADQVLALAFSPDGTLLASADSANDLHLWDDLDAGNTLCVSKDHEEEIRCLAFSPDGNRLASGGADRLIRVRDPRRSEGLPAEGKPIVFRSNLAVSPDASRLARSCSTIGLHVWETANGQVVLRPQENDVFSSMAYSSDGQWLAAGGNDARIHLWNARTGTPHKVLEGQKGRVAALAFAPDSQTLASASAADGLVWLWNVSSGEPVLVIPEAADGCTVEALAFHPQGRLLAAGGIDWLATGGSDGAVSIWDVVQPGPVIAFDGGTVGLAFHPTGRRLASASLSDRIFVWDMQTGERILELAGHDDRVMCVAYSPDGRWLASGGDDRTLRLWDAETGRPEATHKFDTQIKALCFTPDGRYLFTANGNTTSYQLEVRSLLGEMRG